MAQPQSLTKLHGLGNDFLVALESRGGRYPTDREERSAAAQMLCSRRRGIGADGLIFGDAGEGAIDLRMALYNADGSRAEISGNGIRCLAHAWAIDNGTKRGKISIATDGGLRALTVVQQGATLASVRVEMGAVTLGADHADLAAEFGAASARGAEVGNPHIVLWFDSLEGRDAAVVGPALERRFEGGINVHLAQRLGRSQLSLLHWERGVGVTEACGSGATAAAVMAHEAGDVDDVVEVLMVGGGATVEVADSPVLEGPSELIAWIEVPE